MKSTEGTKRRLNEEETLKFLGDWIEAGNTKDAIYHPLQDSGPCAILRLATHYESEFNNLKDAIYHPLQDSGQRREFDTGAVRDMQEGKGRCDLLPACAILRLAKHYESGAQKYEDRNWEQGIPISVMIDSAMRHLLKYMDGQTDEDHLTAVAWNILGAMWMEEKKPELQDLDSRRKHRV